MQLKNKVAVITGGSSGLGEATVRRFLAQHAQVAIFDLNDAAGKDLVAELGDDRLAYFQVNVSNTSEVSDALAKTQARFGGINICCNYAGILLPEKVMGKDGMCSLDKFSRTIETNLIGTFNVIRHVAAIMVKNHPENGCQGVIINTASIAAYEGQIGQAGYSASKAGILGMMLPIARDLAKWGIRVNTIAPGIIHTPIFDGVKEEIYHSLQQQVLFPKRLGSPDEVAHIAQTIVENDYLNAEVIRIDGGIRMQER